ncbi:DNA internalization-related competence protein ComEC/Rec2 [Halomonas sp. Bachu 37]|uniref:DNA internalization-related competence protein ComEC/Rec2 n=1 Tax=Halomonas kashgarensis TaxID=3084920 RepID=UPI0032166BFB
MQTGVAVPVVVAALLGVGLALPGNVYWVSPFLFLASVALILLPAVWRHPWRLLLVLALVLASASIHLQRGGVLPLGLSGEDLQVEAVILEHDQQPNSQRLLLAVKSCHAPSARPDCNALRRARVSFYSSIEMDVGERWRLTLRLRPPRGFVNPDTFDYEAWLWREGIQATGYVRAAPAPVRLAPPSPSLRQMALDYLDRQPVSGQARRWLAALTLGASERLEPEDWELLNASGTTHLVVISGLHIGLITAFALLLSRIVARLVTPLNWRLRAWPWWAAGSAAIGYTALSGMSPPALRAMIMALVGLWVASGRHAPGPWQGWWLALAIVVLLDPLAVWRPGMWLSFLAVAWLIVIWQGRKRPQGWRGWLWGLTRTQLLLAPLMAAAVLLAFSRVAPAAPVINLVAVPWVSMILVPLALVGWLVAWVPGLGTLCWWLFAQALEPLIVALEAGVQWFPLWQPPGEWLVPLALGLGLLALAWGLPSLPGALRLGTTGLLGALLLVSEPDARPPGLLTVRIHDVGQGQLIDLRSANYRLLYDTGPRFGSGFMPLSGLWPPGQSFDTVIISHADNDHAGGVTAMDEHQVKNVLAPQGETVGLPFTPCFAGQNWKRDDVSYRIVWPPRGENTLPANARSCVLEVSVGQQRLLITGDVGTDEERRFLAQLEPGVDVLVAGHHGSRSSSGAQFVQQMTPTHVIFSAGRDNAFQHPDNDVVRRFRREQSCLWNTAHDGAIDVELGRGDGVRVSSMRSVFHGLPRC